MTAEHVTAIVVAIKNKMDLAVGVAIGSSMQIALFMTPSLVVLGWIIGEKMSLSNKSPLHSPNLTVRFRDFPSCSDFCIGCNDELFDYGWQVKLDGGGHAAWRLYYCRYSLLALP